MAEFRKVALFGATGDLGSAMLSALTAAGDFEVTVFRRPSPSSTAAAPAEESEDKVRVVSVSDTWPTEELTAKLRGQDAVVVCVRMRDPAAHLRLAEAAAAAGVRRFVPPDFGSVDSRSPRARELVRLFDNKVRLRERLEALSSSTPSFTYTSLVCGHFFDWGLRENFLHFDLAARTADILGDGSLRSSNSTLARVAEVTVAVLRRPAATANRTLMVQSFCISQLDVLRSLERATGNKKWDVTFYDADQFIRDKKVLADEGDLDAVEDIVFALGAVDGNWEEQQDFAMDLLGLKDESLDEVVRKVVAEKQQQQQR